MPGIFSGFVVLPPTTSFNVFSYLHTDQQKA